jgi:NitT/TauT family transport system substrate-binding protein
MDEDTALQSGLMQLNALMHVFPLEQANVKQWGEANPARYGSYLGFLVKWGVVKHKVPAADLITNDLIGDINTFDAAGVVKAAKTYQR